MMFKMLSNERTEMLSLLRKKGKGQQPLGTYFAQFCGIKVALRTTELRAETESMAPSFHQTCEFWETATLPEGCQPFPHGKTLTCTNRECRCSNTSFKDGVDLGREGVDYSASQANYFDLML